MAHIALYRKWRPLTFEDVVEQHHIVTTLKNSIKNHTVNHAYLFCGTRGTGKTTLAKIFARAVNCQNSKDGSPCNECITCKGILEGSLLDVVEIDAASNNGVDDVREIKEAVMYVPAVTRYKVYIIDEVHMLSTGAFNALLKTLEEPPSNVIFILATTEPHKLPATILSRCQRFDFKRITISGMEERLALIAEDSDVNADKSALRLIARLSEGGMRDAISLLDQCIAQGASDITYELVAKISGLTAAEAINNFAGAIINKHSSVALRAIKDAMDEGRDLIPLCNQLIDWFRNLMLYKTGGEALTLIDLDQEELDYIKRASDLITIERNIEIIIELSEAEARLKWADNPRIIMEVTAVKLCSDLPQNTDVNDDVLDSLSAFEDRIRQMEEKVGLIQSGIKIAPEGPEKNVLPRSNSHEPGNKKDNSGKESEKDQASGDSKNKKTAKDRQRIKEKKSKDKIDIKFLDNWPQIIERAASKGNPMMHAFRANTKCTITDDNVAYIVFPPDDTRKKTLSSAKHIDPIIEAIKEVLGVDVTVKIVDENEIIKIPSLQTENARSEHRNEISGDNADPDLERVKTLAEKNGIPFDIKD
ncbi:MAG: DNA polymerase III subunit gamma/tau [Acetivibrionales bacterium]|jgi:DNA polymerase-3 subunit gamma/tau